MLKALLPIFASLSLLSGCFVLTTFDVEPEPDSAVAVGGAAGEGGTASSGVEGDGGDGGHGGDETNGSGGGTTSECDHATDCPSHADDSPCQLTQCVAGLCVVELAVAGTAAGDPTPGDCATSVCDGRGGITTAVDDADAPDDGDPCTDQSCVGGQPVVAPMPSGTPCGTGGALACDGKGACTGCATDAACGDDTACLDHACDLATNTCITTPAPNGTPCPGDGVFCNGAEVCQAGSCVSPGDPCPWTDSCLDGCNEAADDCSAPGPDGEFCSSGPKLGCCQAGTCITDDPNLCF